MEISSTTTSDVSSVLRTLEDYESESSTSGTDLDQDAFLEILVAQLTYQDPLEPTTDTEFIAQLAQFTMLEQIQELSEDVATQQAFDYVGKYVYLEGDDDTILYGKVDGVIQESDVNYVIIDGEMYEADSVIGVIDTEAAEGTSSEEIVGSADLIGKQVTATYYDEDGEETEVEGIVESITITDGIIYANIGDYTVAASNITAISEAE